MERRGILSSFITVKIAGRPVGDTDMINTKPFSVSQSIVLEAYQRVQQNRGSAGVDGMSLEEFKADSRKHLYRIWNRMSSGSYMPLPVLLVEYLRKVATPAH